MKKEIYYYIMSIVLLFACVALFFAKENTYAIISLTVSAISLLIAIYEDIDNIKF